MTRVKRGVSANKRRKNVLSFTKGFRWHRKSHYAAAKEAMIKAGKYAHRDRRAKKRTFRALWITRLNNALRLLGAKYSTFIASQKTKNIDIDRKVLSQMAVENPKTFQLLVEKVQA
jgi:large subunit ribosomal protein L20